MLQALFAFNWIEMVAVPLAVSLMEAQPIVLILLFFNLLFSGKSNTIPLGESDIVLLLLGSYWWIMFVKRVGPSRQKRIFTPLLSLLGLVIALALLVGIHISLIANVPALILCITLITLVWLRRMYQGQLDLHKEQLISSFKVNVTILLIILVCVATGLAPRQSVLLNALVFALPVFFLSSLLAFSLHRLAQVRREQRFLLRGSLSSNTTWQWSITLIALWSGLVAIFLLFQTFLFPPLAVLLIPFRNAVEAFFLWVNNFFLSLSHRHAIVPPKKKPFIPHFPKAPPSSIHYLVIYLLSILLVLLLLALVAYWLYHAHEDEVRERLSLLQVWRSRRQRRKQLDGETEPEALDPMSARARYRMFLQGVAKRDETLGYRPHETPIEYQARLLSTIKPNTHDQQSDAPPDAVILDELTRAYTVERYAGKQSDTRQRLYLHTWVPYLLQRLTGNSLTQSLRKQFRRMFRA